MKLLICTQTVDARDTDLGFFIRWIETFAQNCEQVTIFCLHTGVYTLPSNVTVVKLGANRLSRVFGILSESMKYRHAYDTVFVHMNPEYVVVAGWLWRLLGKRIALWYMHKNVDFKLRIATFFVHDIFTASTESFRLKSKKVQVMGHGIDTELFTPDPHIVRGTYWLSVGRLYKSKRHDRAIQTAAAAGRDLRIVGDGPERASLERLAQSLHAKVTFVGGVPHSRIRDEFRRAGLFLHTSETGSLDKLLLEAIACGCPVQTFNPAFKKYEQVDAAYIREHHSLSRLIPRIIKALS